MRLSKASRAFIHGLIRENKYHDEGGYHLHVNDLCMADKKIFLLHLCMIMADEIKWEVPISIEAGILEYQDQMQQLINQEIDQVYWDDMRQLGLIAHRHTDNGEVYFIRK